jgi:ribulose-5-phosphate 4-epimerase/fuculose-1-phosphate aldolase
MHLDSIKENLSKAYNIIAILGLDDLIYTHLSGRSSQKKSFYIVPFGMCFNEVLPNSLVEVSFSERDSNNDDLNATIHIIHGRVYLNRPDIQYIFHIHTPAITAVSSMHCGLMPITQWALHFYNRLNYHGYNALALESSYDQDQLVEDLGDKFVMLMKNHGALICGRTIEEAMYYAYHLEQACKTQCMIGNKNEGVEVPTPEICERALQDIMSLEHQTMQKTWEALVRKLKTKN